MDSLFGAAIGLAVKNVNFPWDLITWVPCLMSGFLVLIVISQGLTGVAAVGIPVVIGAAGFTGAGIAIGSLGAKMMSVSAIANGGGVAAGGVVATLQSIGAAGMPTAVSAAASATGAVLGAIKDVYG